MYSYKFTKQVEKIIRGQSKNFLKIFFEKMEILSGDPYENILDVKPLKGYKNCYRLRIGKYRFLYEVRDNELIIYMFKGASRGDVYK